MFTVCSAGPGATGRSALARTLRYDVTRARGGFRDSPPEAPGDEKLGEKQGEARKIAPLAGRARSDVHVPIFRDLTYFHEGERSPRVRFRGFGQVAGLTGLLAHTACAGEGQRGTDVAARAAVEEVGLEIDACRRAARGGGRTDARAVHEVGLGERGRDSTRK